MDSVCDLSYPVDNSQGCYVAQCDLQGGEQVGHQELLTLVRVAFCAWAPVPVDLCRIPRCYRVWLAVGRPDVNLAVQAFNGTVPGIGVEQLGFQHSNVCAAAERAGLELGVTHGLPPCPSSVLGLAWEEPAASMACTSLIASLNAAARSGSPACDAQSFNCAISFSASSTAQC